MIQAKTDSFTPSPRNFNLMVLGQIVSILGSSLLRFALSLYVLDVTGSESTFASLYAVSSIPLLLAPLGGAIADRYNRRNLMVIFDFSSSAVVLALILLMGMGNHSVLMIGTIMVVLAVISSLYAPAVTASVPLLVAGDRLEGANGVVQAVQALSGVAAPILGGVLYGSFGVEALIHISCIAFFLSAVMEMFIKIPFVKRASTNRMVKMIAVDMKEGFLYVVRQSLIWKAALLATMLNFLLTPLFIVGAPIILRKTMGSSDATYGLGMGMVQGATIAGALTVGFFAKRLSPRTLYRWLLTVAALTALIALSVTPTMLGVGLLPSLALFLLCAVPIAMVLTILSIYIITKVQKETPNEYLGKVMAIIMAVAQCATPLGQILYGVMFESFSQTLYWPILAISLALLAVTALTHRMLANEEVD